ncbi:MAG: family 20 glycosylhydrolase [Ignavibacteriales bacterium]|nr:family 20 glycosylhydrolase [Ignavibacteriales bacterium]
MKTLLSLLLFGIFTLTLSQEKGHVTIIPEPRSVTAKTGHFKITSTTKIILGKGNAAEQFIAQQLNDELAFMKATQMKVTDEKSIRKLSTNYIFIGSPGTALGKKFLKERKGTLTSEMKTEGYFLEVDSKGIVIIAESEKGLFYGAMSLVQLIKKEGRSVTVPAMSIHDYPLQKIRGITDDISRGQISTVENFKKIIRFCARHKMNVYSPYIEDVFLFKNHNALGKDRGALSAAEWKELDAYAKKYFVEMIPIFETLGHWENILLRPEYAKFGEFPGAHTVNVSDEMVYALLDEMIGEIAASFSSPYFNIAADESWDVGLGANKERVAKSDLATVHAEHYKRIFEIVKKHGKKPMMYGDIILDHPDILKKIPNDVVMVDWHYGASFDYTSPEIFKSAGFPYVVSPAVWNFTNPFPNYLNTFLNIYYLNLDGYKNGSLGMLCSNWNDFGGEGLRELNYYGYAWTAECAWNPLTANTTTFDKNFFNGFFDKEQDELRAVYSILLSPANQYHWYDLWRHPMLPGRENMIWESRPPLIQRVQSIKSTMPYVVDMLNEAKEEVTINADHLPYLEFIARLNLWFAKKIEVQEKIKLLLKDSVRTKTEIASDVTALAKPVVEQLNAVKSEFEKVWHRTNKPQGLALLLHRYDRQAAYWNELIEQVNKGDFAVDPSLKSQWIYHPKANPGVKDSVQVRQAYFRKRFMTAGNISSAKLQLLGDTWSKLYVNGKFAGEVMARRSLSLIVENQRAKIIDIKPYLTDSLNVIAVEAQNFQENGSGGTNVYGEFILTDGSVQTMNSDDTWKVTDAASNGWMTASFNDSSWVAVSPKKYSVPVVQPNLTTGRTSWFER